MRVGKILLAGVLASTIALGGGAALAQDGTPEASPGASPEAEGSVVILVNAEGTPVADAMLVESEEGVTITVTEADEPGLEPGEHGIHIHETGVCDASGETPFESAGGHFNPTGARHGAPGEESHAGDLGNLTVEGDGTIRFEITTSAVTLEPGAENSLDDQDGSALVIHANPDDLETDPSGESGDRLACGVIFASKDEGVATPAVGGTPEATPAG